MSLHPSGRPSLVQIVTGGAAVPHLFGGQDAYLSQESFRITVVASPSAELHHFARCEGVTAKPIPLEREIDLGRDVVALARLYRLLRGLEPSIVHSGTPKAGLLGTLAAWLARIPVRVYTLHGLRLETAVGWKRRLLWLTERLACGLATHVVCVSQSVRSRAMSLGLVSAGKARVLGAGSANGVDLNKFSQADPKQVECLRSRLGIPVGSAVLGFVGRLTRDKGIADLVDAFRRLKPGLPGSKLLLVGGFEEGDPVPASTQSLIAWDPDIKVTGFVPDPAPYLHLMDAVVLPSYREGFPTVALEAAAAGKPVIASRATGTVDAVKDGVTGRLVEPHRPAELAAVIKELLQDQDLRLRMGQAARERAAQNYSSETVWRHIADFYRVALKGGVPGPKRQPCVASARKRALDVVGSVVAMLLAVPVLVIAASAVFLTLGRPVLFRQQRSGLGGCPFTLLKFRTMRAAGTLTRLADAERTTRLGRWLRKFSIDEMPQLWNVLKGEMSLVGPRPLLTEYLDRYSADQRQRHDVKPGLTGLAQVEGRNSISWERRFELDREYAENWNLSLDMKILARTAALLAFRSGGASDGAVEMPEFLGASPTPGSGHTHAP